MPEHCIVYSGRKLKSGYGIVMGYTPQGKRTSTLAHRIAWKLLKGPIPKGQQVLHRCDNPSCINVDHLFLGTQKDNMADMKAKGRARFGGGVGAVHVRADPDLKQRILADSRPVPAIAAEHGMHGHTIYRWRREAKRTA